MADAATDGELLAGVASGDRAALASLYERYSKRLHDFARRTPSDQSVGAARFLHEVRRPDQPLRRDARPVRALAPNQPRFDADHVQAGVEQPEGHVLATRSDPENDYVGRI